ncbi:hypothetical protein CTAYLR_004649 [Chrysophaeum taylorii]|uniref:GOST seven transmembrane domain-containing protein n=1 Tax=Chrysophaeum taylorii TaxID=2483200 RepID=A0AAD7XS16_9STRA|nr:hypothetical protein CTAYLR_004649 [Chrysophaeum taylorii]
MSLWVVVFVGGVVAGYKYELAEKSYGKRATFTETFQYGGESSYMRIEGSVKGKTEIRHVMSRHKELKDFPSICSPNATVPKNKHFKRTYEVKRTGFHYLVLEACDFGGVATFAGRIEIRNPYGFVPAIYAGLVPFEIARAFASLLVLIIFGTLCVVHRENVLKVHLAILATAAVAAADAGTYCASYLIQNYEGVPPCCPFTPSFTAALALELVQRTGSRVLLLVICSGLGLVRSTLASYELAGIVVIATCYVAASAAVLAHQVQNSATPQDNGGSLTWDVPLLVVDLAFVTWIYSALVHMIDLLAASKQTYKLRMFSRLYTVLSTFVVLAGVVTAAVTLSSLGAFRWPPELYWLQLVPLEILNFAALAAICVIWQPNARSKLLLHHDQLATTNADDDDDDDGVEMVALEQPPVDDDDRARQDDDSAAAANPSDGRRPEVGEP